MVRLSYGRKLGSFRVKAFLCAFVGLFVAYQIVQRLLSKTPWTYVGWHDTEFRLSVDENEIIILRWTSLWGEQYDAEVLTAEKCPFLRISPRAAKKELFTIPCRLSYDRRYYRASDALVFHSFDLMREEMPQQRSSSQIWVYLQQESPIYTKLSLQDYSNSFNWTMTYRRDSDVYHPYARAVLLKSSSTVPSSSMNNSNAEPRFAALTKRPKLIAWIVSSCESHSRREYLVHQLQKYVHVDVYGWCGQECPSYAGNCYAHVSKTHKFYLSFENSLCVDYITEKFFNALKANLVSVVYGGASSEDYEAIAPPGSYIDARKFQSVQQLAEYLIFLDRNDEEYMKYFKWKVKFKVVQGGGWCNLCQRVFEHLQLAPASASVPPDRKRRTSKWYRNLWVWWNYMSADKGERGEVSDGEGNVIVPKYTYNLRTCKSPPKNLTETERSYVNLEPRFLNGKAIYKYGKWAKEVVLG